MPAWVQEHECAGVWSHGQVVRCMVARFITKVKAYIICRASWSPVRWRAETESGLLNTEEITALWGISGGVSKGEKEKKPSCKVHLHALFVIKTRG